MPSSSLSQRSQSPPLSVSLLLMLHLFMVLKDTVLNYKFFTLWFEHPSARIMLFPVSSPMNEVYFVLDVVVLIGLVLSKPWSWWLSLVLDAYAFLGHLLWWHVLFVVGFSLRNTAIDFSLAEALASPVILALLFFPGVLKRFSPDQSRVFQSVANKVSLRMIDRITTIVIGLGQMAIALILFLQILLFGITPLLIFPLSGLVTAGILFTGWRSARVASICWQVMFIALFLAYSNNPRIDPWRDSNYRMQAAWASYFVLFIMYLGVSLWFSKNWDRAKPRPLQMT